MEAGGFVPQSGFRHESASRLLRQASHAKRLWSDPARAVNNSLRGGVADPDGPYRSRSGAPYSVSSSQLKGSLVMIHSTTTVEAALELNDVERVAPTKRAPPTDHRTIDFVAPPKVRTPSSPMPPYVEHHPDVDQIGKLSAEAVTAQYEDAVKALEAMGTTLIDCVNRAENMAAGCKGAIAYIQDTAQKYREEAKLIFDRIEQASVMTAEVRSICDEMRKKIEHPSQSA